MSAAIAPNPNDPQAPLGMPARPWWIGYIRELHLDIPLAVESGGTGKNTPLDASDIAETDALKVMTADERTKLTGIAENAEVNTVDSVAGRTGDVTLDASDIAETDTLKILTSTERSKLAGINAGAEVNTVTSVAGRTGAVTLAKSDVGLGNVDNTSDAAKPVSTAAATALDLKQNASNAMTTNTTQEVTATKTYRTSALYYGPATPVNHTPFGFGCGGVAYWRTRQYTNGNLVWQSFPTGGGSAQNALGFMFGEDGSVPNLVLYNTPTAPTAAAGTNTTQLATTAFVTGGIATAIATAMPQFSAVVERTASVTAEVGKYYLNTCTDLEDSAGYLTLTLPSPTGNAGKTIGCGCKEPWSYTYMNEYQAWTLSGHINGVSGNTDYQSGSGYDGKVASVVLWCDGSTWHVISATYGGNRN